MSTPTIWDLKRAPWSNEPRYYPPGQHPATARMRAELEQAERLKAEWDRKSIEHGVAYDTAPVQEFIVYLKQQLADFEALESDHKARDDWCLVRPR